MGIFRKSSRNSAATGSLNIASPFAEPGSLNRVVLSDIYGELDPTQWPIDRSIAISIPAVSKARNLLISVIAPLPLVCLDETGPVADQPEWLYRSDTSTTPFERMAWTIDDLIFTGYSLWTCVRDSDGAIVSAEYVPLSEWRVEGTAILVNDKPISEDECIFFNSPFEGLLTVGARTLRGARDIETQIAAKLAQPIALTVIRQTDAGNPLDQDEIDGLLADWTKARRSPEGALGFLPAGLEIDTHGGDADPALFLEARNAVRTDIASFLALSASMLDGTSSIDSLTYVTKSGETSRFLNFDLNFWTAPIEARLSADDITKRGTRIRFDKSELNTSDTNPTGSPVKD
jgi:hypothetical protein